MDSAIRHIFIRRPAFRDRVHRKAIRNLNIDPAIVVSNGIFESPRRIEAPDAQRKLDSHSETQIKVAG